MSDVGEEWKKIRQELGNFMCRLNNAADRAITTDEQRKNVYQSGFDAGWENGRNDLWDRIDDYFAIKSDDVEKHKLAVNMGYTAFCDIVSTMSPNVFTERLTAYHDAAKKEKEIIHPGDECYYMLSGDSYDNRFIITSIREGENGLKQKEKFFDGIYHDGRTILDGSLRLVTKTGNYYPVLYCLSSPFDEQPMEEKRNASTQPNQ